MLFRVVSPAFTRKAVSVGRASRLGSAALTSTRGPASGLCGRLFSSNNTEIPAPASAAEGAAGSETIETVRSQMAEKEKQLKELKDSYLLALADMENLRQRAKRDNEAASLFAIQRFSKDIISVADVLEMALASVGPSPTNSSAPHDAEKKLGDLIEGLSMTLAEVHKAFQKHGLTVIDPLHQKFNPNEHNALFEVPSVDVDPGTIVNVQKKGYMLHQRVIRPAEVGIARKP